MSTPLGVRPCLGWVGKGTSGRLRQRRGGCKDTSGRLSQRRVVKAQADACSIWRGRPPVPWLGCKAQADACAREGLQRHKRTLAPDRGMLVLDRVWYLEKQ
jgi:hypothetical protein